MSTSALAHTVTWQAVIATATADADPPVPTYFPDAGPTGDSLPPRWVEITVSRRYGSPRRGCGRLGRLLWRVEFDYFASTSAEATAVRDALMSLEDTKIAALSSSRLVFDSEDDVTEDDNRYSGSMSLTYDTPV